MKKTSTKLAIAKGSMGSILTSGVSYATDSVNVAKGNLNSSQVLQKTLQM